MLKENLCFNCENVSKYKCPECRIKYCSVGCFKIHKETCKPIKKAVKRPRIEPFAAGEDTVPKDRLELLEQNEAVLNHLSNKYLRVMIESIVSEQNATDVRFSLDRAMQEPIFAEFANDVMSVLSPTEEET